MLKRRRLLGSEKGNIDDFVLDKSNPNLGTDRGMDMLRQSIEENKYGRPALADKHRNIVAGNKMLSTAKSLGSKEAIVVESDGSVPIIHVRTDLEGDDARKMAYADNRTSELNLNWDWVEISKDLDDGLLLLDLWDDEELEKGLDSITMPTDLESEESEWVEFSCLLPKTAMLLVESELDRIKHEAGFDGKDKRVADGVALELMAMNSAGVPVESLE